MKELLELLEMILFNPIEFYKKLGLSPIFIRLLEIIWKPKRNNEYFEPNYEAEFSSCYNQAKEFLMFRGMSGLGLVSGTQKKIAKIYGLNYNPYLLNFFKRITEARFFELLEHLEKESETYGDFRLCMKLSSVAGDITDFLKGNGLAPLPYLFNQAKKCHIFGLMTLNTCEMLHNKNFYPVGFYKKYNICPKMLSDLSIEQINELIGFYQKRLYPNWFARIMNEDMEPSLFKEIHPIEHMKKIVRFLY